MEREACLWQIDSCRYCFRIGSSSFAPPASSQSPARDAPTSKATDTAKEAEFGQSPSEGDLSPNNVRAAEGPGLAQAARPGEGSGSRFNASLCEDTQQAFI